jgi:glycosyltransferase involved in cell wall biosynthesis
MKLAIIRTSYSALNTKSYNVQEIGLAKGLLNQNISTDIYSRFQDVTEEMIFLTRNECNIRLIPIVGFSLFGRITYFPKLIKRLKKEKYEFVQVHEDSEFMVPFILKACKKQNIKTILYQGMYANYKGGKQLYNLLIDSAFKNIIQKNCDIIISKTELAGKYLTEKGYKEVNVLPIGLDFEFNLSTYSKKNKLLKFKSGFENILLYVGKIERRRNPFFLVELLVKLREKEKNVGLVIVGDGPLKKLMIEYAKKKRVKDFIFFIKSVPNNEIHDIYKNSEIVLLPSNYEIYGMVILESLLNGIPVIATPQAGPLSILQNKKLGICLPLVIDKWINSIENYLEKENSYEDKLFRKEFIINNYDWNIIAQRYINFLVQKNYYENKY